MSTTLCDRHRVSHPRRDLPTTGAVIPTLGALVLVQLIRQGGTYSPAFVIGYWLSNWLGVFFIMLSAVLGALGSFFSVRFAKNMAREAVNILHVCIRVPQRFPT